MTQETTEPTTTAPVADDDNKATIEEQPTEVVKEVEADTVREKKGFFASICGCLGGSAPPADNDPKNKPAEEGTKAAADGKDAAADDQEKEETTPASPELDA